MCSASPRRARAPHDPHRCVCVGTPHDPRVRVTTHARITAVPAPSEGTCPSTRQAGRSRALYL